MKIPARVSSAIAIAALVLTPGSSSAQEAGGGSIKDFKKPANPPVYGGKIPKTPKNQTSKPDAVDPAETRSKNPGTLAKKSARSTPAPARAAVAAAAGPPPPTPAPGESAGVNQPLEDAIAAGNDARSSNPPNYAEAEKSYRLATTIAPSDFRAYQGLGNVFFDQQKYSDSAAAYEQAVKLGANSPDIFESLSDTYVALGRFSDALNASGESIKLDAKRPGPYYTRAWTNLFLKQGAAAGDNARAMIERWQPSWESFHPFYMTVVGNIGYRQAGRQDDADKLLAEAIRRCKPDRWECQIVNYLNHKQSAEALLARATDDDKLTEAKTYIGVELMLEGKTEEALPYLEWVKANGNRTFYEFQLATSWLEK
jgi:lipoprotein NlpI